MKKGSITVYLSLVAMIIIALMAQILTEAMYQQDRVRVYSAMDIATESVLAEYARELVNEYGIFFFYSGDGNGNFQNEKIVNRMDEYLYENLEHTNGMLQMQIQNIEIDNKVLATDMNGEPFFQEIVEAYESIIPQKVLEEAQNLKEKEKEAKGKEQEKEKNKVTQEELTVPKDLKVDKEAKKKAEEVPNPVEIINAIKNNGILGLVCDTATLSEQEVDLRNCIANRKLEKGNGKITLDNNPAHRLIYNLYVKDKCSNYINCGEKGTQAGLKYQQEYIVAGKKTDKENLTEVVNKILLIREGINFVYLLTDSEKMAEANTLAIALVGYTGLQPLITAMMFAILGVWAYGESILEVKCLLNGGKIAFEKTALNWKLSLTNLCSMEQAAKGNVTEDAQGMTYEEYLFMLLCNVSKKNVCYRMMDMVEQNIREKTQMSGFRLDHCAWKFTTTVGVRSRKGTLIQTTKEVGY